MSYCIGIVEDEVQIARMLEGQLKRYGFDVWVCENFGNVETDVLKNDIHLLLLDINLPMYDGYYWCKKIRQHSTLPIIFLSARSMDIDQIYAIESGGDDYITKPFSYEVVIAKVNACLRRVYGIYANSPHEEGALIKGVKLDAARFELSYKGNTLSLTKNEKTLLAGLFDAYPECVERQQLLALLWDADNFVEENTLNVNIGRVRKRLSELNCPLQIKTIRNVGYVLEYKDNEASN